MRRVYRCRFSSLDSAAWDAREFLRSRLALLREEQPFEDDPGGSSAGREWAAEELMLRLLQHCVPGEDPRSVGSGQRALTAHLAAAQGATVTWERLVAEQWVRVVWDRWHVPGDLQRVPDDDQGDDGKSLVLTLNHLRSAARQEWLFAVPEAERLIDEHGGRHPATPTLNALVSQGFLQRRGESVHIAPHGPLSGGHGDWLAARLWDRKECGPAGPERLSWWRDRVFGLGVESYGFGEHLTINAREEFENCAWKRVLAEADLIGWERERFRYAAQVSARSGFGVIERGLKVIAPIPGPDPVGQLKWLDRAGPANPNQEERDEIGALISFLVRWRASFRGRHPWDAWVEEYSEASRDRPYLLYKLDLLVGRDPAIAADLLSVPNTAALGVGMLSDRVRSTGRGWNWEAKEDAIRDAEVSVWKDVAECGAWGLHSLTQQQAAPHVASVLERFAALAHPAMGRDPERGARLRGRYELLREVVARWPAPAQGEALAFDRLGEAVVDNLRSMLGDAEIPMEKPAFGVLAWLAAFGSDDRSPWRGSAVHAVVDAYCWSLNAPSKWYHDVPPDRAVWIRLARWLVENDQRAWLDLLAPADFRGLARGIDSLEEGERYTAQRSFLHQLRTHALLLLALAASWDDVRRGEAVPAELEAAIASLLRDWLPGADDRPSMIDADLDVEQVFERQRESLLVAIGSALPRLSDAGRKEDLELLLPALTEVRQIATLVHVLEEGPERDTVRARLASLPISEGTADIHRLDEVQRSVDALLDALEVDRAEVWLNEWAGKARARRIDGWTRWEVGARQRVRLARKRFEEAAGAPLPDWAANDFDARHTNDFFRGVAMLHLDPPRSEEAAKIYESLLRAAPQQPSYAVNLFAARTQLLTHGRGDEAPTPEEDDELRDSLAYGESLMSTFTAEQRSGVEQTYQVNRLYLLHRLRDWPALLSAYQSLPRALQKHPELAAYAARALESSGQSSLAAGLRADTGAASGTEPEPRGTALVDDVEAARMAILRVPEFGMHDQAKAWWGSEVGSSVTRAVLEGCRALSDIAPALAAPEDAVAHEEDRITKLLAELLRQRLLKLCWQVSSQEHGGYTAKDPSGGRGGIGEIDLEVRAGTAHVAVGEAVIANGFDHGDLTKHFRKLFGYTPDGTPMAFLLIWSYGPDPRSVWDRYLREVATRDAPVGHEFQSWSVPAEGPTSHVWHAVSEHAHPVSGASRIAHVLVDLQHTVRRKAAAAAHSPARRPRSTKRKSQGK